MVGPAWKNSEPSATLLAGEREGAPRDRDPDDRTSWCRISIGSHWISGTAVRAAESREDEAAPLAGLDGIRAGRRAVESRDDQTPEFAWTGDRAAAAVLLAFDALDFPVITGTGSDAAADDPTSRAMGVLAAYASPALAKRLSGVSDENAGNGSEAPDTPVVSAHRFGTFEYAGGGLKLGLEARPQGVGLFVVNAASSEISIDPADVVITTTQGSFSPTTLHPVQMARRKDRPRSEPSIVDRGISATLGSGRVRAVGASAGP